MSDSGPPIDAVSQFRFAYCGYWCFFLLLTHIKHCRFLPQRLGLPEVRVMGQFRVPRWNGPGFTVTGIFFVIALAGAAGNWWSTMWLVLSVPCYFLYFGQIIIGSEILKKSHSVPLILGILAMAPWLEPHRFVPAANVPLLLIKLVLVQSMVSAGMWKLKNYGWSWADGKALRKHLIKHHLWGDIPLAEYLAQNLIVCRILSCLVLLMELSFFLVLVSPVLGQLYSVLAVGFHIGTAFSMRIHYWKYLGPAYLVFWVG